MIRNFGKNSGRLCCAALALAAVFANEAASAIDATSVKTQTKAVAEKKQQAKNEPRRVKGLKYDPALHAQVLEATGGWAYNTAVASGTFAFVNLQQRIPVSAIASVADSLQRRCMLLVSVKELKSGSLTFRTADNLLVESGGKLAAFIVDDENLPSLLVAPDSRWAIVNVAPLSLDKPNLEVLASRLSKEMMRAFCMLFGVGNTMANRGPMQKISSVKDLDDILLKGLANESATSVQRHAPYYGFTPIKRAFYRQAVQEGWAPAPTNDFQKAIWEKVKADKERGPTNPITIQPPKAK